jgi:hypothetical protein
MVFLKLNDSCPQDSLDIMGLTITKSPQEFKIPEAKVNVILSKSKFVMVLNICPVVIFGAEEKSKPKAKTVKKTEVAKKQTTSKKKK